MLILRNLKKTKSLTKFIPNLIPFKFNFSNNNKYSDETMQKLKK